MSEPFFPVLILNARPAAGKSEIIHALKSTPVEERIARFHIGPLDRREMREYIERRLAVAGHHENDLFEDDSFDAVYRFSGGIPRLINTLCDTALLVAFADEKRTVAAVEVISAAEELGWQEHESNTGIYDQLRQIEMERKPAVDSHVTSIEIRSNGEVVDVLTFPLGRVIVGRSPDNEIYIKSKFVSRHHAQIVSDESGCVIEDLNSTNGVFLGEKQVKKYRLRDGDTISLGVHELIYHDIRQESESDGSQTSSEESIDEDAEQDSAVNEI